MKNYKIVRLAATHYPIVEEFVYRKIGKNNEISYSQIQDALFSCGVMYSDGFSKAMRKLGQEAEEVVWDFELLQKQWALEKGIKLTNKYWKYEVLIAQIKELRPDVIYLQGTELAALDIPAASNATDNIVSLLREQCSFIRCIVIFSGYPSTAARVKNSDILLSSDPAIVRHYRQIGITSNLCYHSFDESFAEYIKSDEKSTKFSFVGSSRAPESRYWALRKLLSETNLEIWINEESELHKNKPVVSDAEMLKLRLRVAIKATLGMVNQNSRKKIAGLTWCSQRIRDLLAEIDGTDNTFTEQKLQYLKDMKRLPGETLREMYPERTYPPLVGVEMFKRLSQSQVTFNKHEDRSNGCVGNMRMFEATGAGSCLLTDSGRNIKDLFDPDHEVVTYSSVDEAVEKWRYLREHKNESEAIAKAGQKRTLENHTVLNRCEQIDEIIQDQL